MGSWLAADSFLAGELDSADLQKKLQAKNEEELAKFEEKIKDADANHGETELSDALRAKATYLAKIGEKVHHNILVGSPANALTGQSLGSLRIRPVQTSWSR